MRSTLLSLCLAAMLGVSAQTADAQEAAFAPVAAAIDARDWDRAYALARPQGDAAYTLVTWQRLRQGQGQLAEYESFFAAHPNWPARDRLHRAGEFRITAGTDPSRVIAYFDGALPRTGQGAVRLAGAMIAQGETEQAHAMLAEVWINTGLDAAGLQSMLSAYPRVLAPHHSARVDEMLWRWRTDDATRLMRRLQPDEQRLVQARIALITQDRRAATLLSLVPEDFADDPGLAADRFNRFADLGDYPEAIALLQSRNTSAASLGQPFRWASWRASLTRWMMREGRADEAYVLARDHFLASDGRDARFFSDLEWLAGYIALRYLDDPAQALVHFTALSEAVDSPISTSRADYWRARALDELGRTEAATAAYTRAAQHQTAFYGLLAADHLGLALDPALTGSEVFPDWQTGPFADDAMVQATQLLLDTEDRSSATVFTAHMAGTFDRTRVGQLGDMLAAQDQTYLTVLTGKAAVRRGIVLPAHYFPLHEVSTLDLPAEPALSLAIARRESEFNIGAGSPVGALGMMQLMPATAREVSGELDIPFSRGRLTSDWRYNAALGARYLANLEETFGPSPVMIAAGYNAGPSRPRTWMTQRGDPRKGQIDIVDWIELIPFTETRNYVMRVTESIPVYRARLTGQTGPVEFRALLIGAPPLPRPVARPLVDEDNSPDAPAPLVSDAAPVVVIPDEDAAIPTAPRVAPARPVGRPVGADAQTPQTAPAPRFLSPPIVSDAALTVTLPAGDEDVTGRKRVAPRRPLVRPQDAVPRPPSRPTSD